MFKVAPEYSIRNNYMILWAMEAEYESVIHKPLGTPFPTFNLLIPVMQIPLVQDNLPTPKLQPKVS